MVTIREIATDTVDKVKRTFIEEEEETLPPRGTLEIVQDSAVGLAAGYTLGSVVRRLGKLTISI